MRHLGATCRTVVERLPHARITREKTLARQCGTKAPREARLARPTRQETTGPIRHRRCIHSARWPLIKLSLQRVRALRFTQPSLKARVARRAVRHARERRCRRLRVSRTRERAAYGSRRRAARGYHIGWQSKLVGRWRRAAGATAWRWRQGIVAHRVPWSYTWRRLLLHGRTRCTILVRWLAESTWQRRLALHTRTRARTIEGGLTRTAWQGRLALWARAGAGRRTDGERRVALQRRASTRRS